MEGRSQHVSYGLAPHSTVCSCFDICKPWEIKGKQVANLGNVLEDMLPEENCCIQADLHTALLDLKMVN